jgi:hypothetical protein
MVVNKPTATAAADRIREDDPADAGLDTDLREPTMTLTGWRRFVEAPAASIELLPDKRWMALPAVARQAYYEARLTYHSERIIVATSAVRAVARQGRLLTLLNRREISARRGLIVSGPQTTGKTTALKQLGRTHELMVRQRSPGRLTDRIPVVYVTTPPKGSPRKLAMEFARFLGLPPVKRGYNTTDIAETPPTSPTRSVRSCCRREWTWCWSTLPTAGSPVIDVHLGL